MTKTYRELYQGIGQAVAERSILRREKSGKWETWGQVANRVSLGNVTLLNKYNQTEKENLENHIASGRLAMSGRHLQHGDANQKNNTMECFTNCSTSATSFLSFYLCLNGSGVGRSYDDALMITDWSSVPDVICTLDSEHKDFDYKIHTELEQIDISSPGTKVITVKDSREGWTEALELWENLAYSNPNRVEKLVLDFSGVRPKGSPISGMQGRPASGPAPVMEAFEKSLKVCKSETKSWKIAMHIDHYFAECVRVGGARRSARIATKNWKDSDIVEFIEIKNKGDLWTANNSVAVDKEFWDKVKSKDTKACEVLEKISQNSYGTGEPGLINVDKLHQVKEDLPERLEIGSDLYKITSTSDNYYQEILKICKTYDNYHIVNPCGEISLAIWGGFCVISDVIPYHADTIEEAEDSFRAATRAMMRVNTMNSIYKQEVERTNRIGIGMTGVFEFAWKFFKLGFLELVDESKSMEFWKTIKRFSKAVEDESEKYAKELGVKVPHTALTIKPAGTTSKLFGLTEGWHLPAMATYLRWVQFRKDSDLAQEYKDQGYPTKDLVKYMNTTVVGFPTKLEIANLDIGDKLTLAGEATPEQQYKWLMLGEKYWLGDSKDNQISYTLKYDPNKINMEEFQEMLVNYQSQIKCCSVMPQIDDESLLSIYEYLPEEKISKEYFEAIELNIKLKLEEDIGKEHLDCGAGGCPIDFKEVK